MKGLDFNIFLCLLPCNPHIYIYTYPATSSRHFWKLGHLYLHRHLSAKMWAPVG